MGNLGVDGDHPRKMCASLNGAGVLGKRARMMEFRDKHDCQDSPLAQMLFKASRWN